MYYNRTGYNIVIYHHYTGLSEAALSAPLLSAPLLPLASILSAPTGVCERNIPLTQASAQQKSSRNSSPAPDLVFFKLSFQRVFYFDWMFVFHRHRYEKTPG